MFINIKVRRSRRKCIHSRPGKGQGKVFEMSVSDIHAHAGNGDERALGYHLRSLNSLLCRQLAFRWTTFLFLGPATLRA